MHKKVGIIMSVLALVLVIGSSVIVKNMSERMDQLENLNNELTIKVKDLQEKNIYNSTSNDIDKNRSLIEKNSKHLTELDSQNEASNVYDLSSVANELKETMYYVDVLKNIVYSGETYRVIVGNGVSKISDTDYEISYDKDNTITTEIIKISSDCKTFAVGQYSYGQIELQEFIDNLFFYESEQITLIEINNEIRYMFQGSQL